MQRFLRGKKTLAGLAIAGGAAIAAVGCAAPALGFFSPPLLLQIHVNRRPRWWPREPVPTSTVQIQCAGAQTATVSVSLTERSGSEVATGSGSALVGCTNHNQTILVPVTASSGKVFRKGTAIANGVISACATKPKFCASEQDHGTIAIGK